MEKENTLNKTLYHVTEKVDIIQTISIALIAFFIPTFSILKEGKK